MPPETVVEVSRFEGLNFRDAPGRIKDSELVECLNYDIGRAGELVKRTGVKKLASAASLGANTVTLLGYFQTDTLNELLARAGSNLYKSIDGGATWVVLPGGPHGNVEYGCQYTNKFYFVRRDNTILEYTGAAVTAIVGSPTGSFVCAYKDRLYVLNTYALGALSSRLYFSKVADFSATGWPSTNFVDISTGDGDFLVAATQLQDVFTIFKSKSTWMLYVSGDPTTWTLRNSSPEIGCLSRYAFRVIENYVFFLGPRGIYRSDGSSYQEISLPIHSIFFGQFAGQVLGIGDVNKAALGWWEDKLIFLLYFVNQNATWSSWLPFSWDGMSGHKWQDVGGGFYQHFVYHMRSGAWTKYDIMAGSTFNMVEVQQPSASRGLIMGSRAADGNVYRFGDIIYHDGDTVLYFCVLKTKEFDLGSPSRLKRGKFLVIDAMSRGNHQIQNIVEGASRGDQLVNVAENPRRSFKVRGPGYFRVWQLSSLVGHLDSAIIYGFSLYAHNKNTVARNPT